MKKIEEAMCEAVKNRKDWKLSNTEVISNDGSDWVKVFFV